MAFAVSLVFYLYLTDIASYQSVFGGLASVIVALAYLYISATVFLFGFVLARAGAVWDAIERLRWLALSVAAASFLTFIAVWSYTAPLG